MEQRTDDTARLPGRAAEDAGPPAGSDEPDTSVDITGDSFGQPADDGAGWAATGWSQPAAADSGYQSGESGHAYQAGPGGYPSGEHRDYADDGRGYAAELEHGYGPEDSYGRRATDPAYPAPSAASSEYPRPPAETVYGASGGQQNYRQRNYSDPPYPSQVTSPGQPAGSRTTGPADWAARMNGLREAATARLPRPQVTPKRSRTRRRGRSQPRQAHLLVARVEPWSVMKFSFMISLVCFVILFVAVTLLYGALAGLGVFDAIQKALANVTSSQGSTGVNASHWFAASTILGYTALLGALDVVLITAFATIGSVIYNLTSRLVGGIEVTLRETE